MTSGLQSPVLSGPHLAQISPQFDELRVPLSLLVLLPGQDLVHLGLRKTLSNIKAEVESSGTLNEQNAKLLVECFGAESSNFLQVPDKRLEAAERETLLQNMNQQLKMLENREELVSSNELERLQRRRKGEPLPAPLKL